MRIISLAILSIHAFCTLLLLYLCVAALGALSCLVLMFFINAAYAGVTIGKGNIVHVMQYLCTCTW